MIKNKTHCILVEDKKESRILLESYIDDHEELLLLASFSLMTDALELAKKKPNAILLLDIIVRNENSISILESHHLENPIVFITAYKEFAYKAFEINAYDYILKPVTRLQFGMTISKLIGRINANHKNQNSKLFINIIENRVVVKVYFEDILFVESDKEYCQIHTLSGEFRTKMTLKKMEKILCESHLIRIHKSFIINYLFVNKVFKDEIVLKRNYTIPIGRLYKTNVRKLLL